MRRPDLASPEQNAVRAQLEQDLQAWDTIADHRTGTQGDAHTADWLSNELRLAGVAPEVTWFDFERRVPQECYVAAHGERADGVPLFDGGYTDAAGVQGSLSALDSDKTTNADIGLTLFGPNPLHPGTQQLEKARRNPTRQAIVAVAAGDAIRPGLSLLNADYYKTPYGPPVLQVGTEHEAWLNTAMQARAHVKVVAHMTRERTRACNVQATIVGRDKQLAPLVIMTPRSGWWTCTSERGGGISLWLACARHFADNVPPRTVMFTANTGHELGHVGLEHYLNSAPELVNNAHAWVHLGANFAAADSKLLVQASTQPLMSQQMDALRAGGIEDAETTPVGTQPLGEARNIFAAGGSYISLLGNNKLFHHPLDRWPAAVDTERTLAINQAMLQVISQLAHA